jgi:thioredoxin 2
MAPAYERAAFDLAPEDRLLKVDIEGESALAARYGIQSIPMLILFVQDEPVAQSAGARHRPQHPRRGRLEPGQPDSPVHTALEP